MRNIIIFVAVALMSWRLGAEERHTFESNALKADLDLSDGSLVGLSSRLTGWKVIEDPGSGRSFEAVIRLPDGKSHTINASSQEMPEMDLTDSTVSLTWRSLKVGDTGLDISFTATVSVTADGLEYSGHVQNLSDAVVEQLVWPFIGQVALPDNTERMLFQYMNYTKFNTDELYPREAGVGWSNLPEHAFTLVHNGHEGLYLSSLDHEFDEYIRCQYEVIPGPEYAGAAGTSLSKRDHGERKLMKTRIRASRMLYLQPHSSVELVPFFVTLYKGDWHSGADIYKKWRNTWFEEVPRPGWTGRVNSWQQIQINGTGGRINFTFKDLKSYIDECVRYGVDVIQLTGWTKGGQDSGLPSHDPDPRLGSFKELKKAISYGKGKGVQILLFTKFPWADLTTSYHKKYEPYFVLDPALDTCIHPGYNYYTYTQLEGVSTHRFGIFCDMCPDLRKEICSEFGKLLDFGAPGMVFDENQHHAGAMQCFSPDHGHAVPGFNYKGALLLVRDFYEMCRQRDPDFLMVGEGCYDIQSQYYATYTRADYSHEPVLRYLDPDIPIACAVIDHYDLNHVNMCAALRYSISYEVRNFKGRLSEFPRVVEYGMKVDRLREKYSDFLWDGEFLDTVGAAVSGDSIRHTVFVRKDGKKAVVVYNVDTGNRREAKVSVGSGSSLVVATPESPEAAAFDGSISLGPQSMAVIMEQ